MQVSNHVKYVLCFVQSLLRTLCIFRKAALQRHMRYHVDAKPFSCKYCNYTCREQNNLKRHIALHFSERNFVCEICGAAFHAKKTLETHHIYKHENQREFQCTECALVSSKFHVSVVFMQSRFETLPCTK